MRSLFSGKGSIAERKFQLKQIQDLSPCAKRIDFMSLEPSVFAAIEKTALSEARANAGNSGRLFESSIRDDTGRKITTYEGDPMVWMRHHMSPGIVTTINKDAGMHEENVKVRDGQRVQVV